MTSGETIQAPNQSFGSARLKLYVSAIILLAVALGFNALFNFSTLDKLVTESATLKYHIIGEDLKRQIKASVQSGRFLQASDEMEKLLFNGKQRLHRISSGNYFGKKGFTESVENDVAFSIYLPDGKLLSSTAKKQFGPQAPFALEDLRTNMNGDSSPSGQSKIITQNGWRFLQFPIQSSPNEWSGVLVISFKHAGKTGIFSKDLKKQFSLAWALFVSGSVFLVFLLIIVSKKGEDKKAFPQKKITAVMFFIIAPILIVFSGLNTYTASKHYLEISQKKIEMTLALVKEHVEGFLGENDSVLEHAVKEDGQFLKMLKPYPILDALIILDSGDNWIFGAKQENTEIPSALYSRWGDKLAGKVKILDGSHRLEILKGKEQSVGSVVIRVSKDHFIKKSANMILNAGTVVAISILFLIELLIFGFYFIDKPPPKEKEDRPVHFGLIRPVTFLFLFGIDISISFIPLHMEKIYTPLMGLSRDTVMGLPISVEFFFVGIAIFFSGFWNDRRGWHEPFLTGLFLAGTGVLYSWLAPNVIHFVISRAFVGIGYGLTLLAAQGFVIAFSGEKSRARAFAQFIAGLYAGSICGGATGALLAEKLGYSWVFFIGAVTLYSIIAYALIFMRKAMIRPKKVTPAKQQEVMPARHTFKRFFKNRIVLSLIFLSSLPASFAAVGFLNYFSPIYLNRIGASQATIGRILMIYGFSLVYLGPVIADFVDRFDNKRNYVFVGCLLGSIAFLMFFLLEGLLAVTFAVLLLGLSNSFIIASQSTYMLRLKVTHALGAGKAIGIFRASSRVGQAMGPIIFSSLFLSENIRMSITKLGVVYLLTAILFLVFTRRDQNQYKRY